MALRKETKVLGLLTVVAAMGWIAMNPGGQFGISQFGLTTYSRLPIPVLDIQVGADRSLGFVWKTHDIGDATLKAILRAGAPEVVIVGVGWRSAAHVSGVVIPSGVKLITLPTDEALSLYNTLKGQGRRVAIHVHSTC